jgi:hypothetical protein
MRPPRVWSSLDLRGRSKLGTMRCCSVHRTDTDDIPSGPMNRRATERCRDRDGVVGRNLTGTGSVEKAVAEFVA